MCNVFQLADNDFKTKSKCKFAVKNNIAVTDITKLKPDLITHTSALAKPEPKTLNHKLLNYQNMTTV